MKSADRSLAGAIMRAKVYIMKVTFEPGVGQQYEIFYAQDSVNVQLEVLIFTQAIRRNRTPPLDVVYHC
jgi:hypothetical protein